MFRALSQKGMKRQNVSCYNIIQGYTLKSTETLNKAGCW